MNDSRVVTVEFTKRARQYGYVFWKYRQDDAMAELLGNRDTVNVVFMNANHGKKKIDWRYRRISLGWRWTRFLPESKKVLILKMSKPNELEIQCR